MRRFLSLLLILLLSVTTVEDLGSKCRSDVFATSVVGLRPAAIVDGSDVDPCSLNGSAAAFAAAALSTRRCNNGENTEQREGDDSD